MTLQVVTALSLAVAVIAAGFAWRLRRREAARTAARVAALAAAIDDESLPATGGWVTLDEIDLHTRPRGGDAADVAPRVGGGTMFTAEATTSGRPLGPALSLAAAACLVVVGAVLWSATGGEATSVEKTPPPLELLALHHDQDADRLSIQGLLRNPAGGRPLTHVTAVAFVFDRQGSFLGSSRAPVDFTTLSPGEESPFTVVLSPALPSAARYTVSFRRDDSGILPHVDRRNAVK